MSVDQLSQEKRDIQKALLQFERVHGRPSSRHDKETMRPLYDRYRLVKRLTSADHRVYVRSLYACTLCTPSPHRPRALPATPWGPLQTLYHQSLYYTRPL